MINYITFASWEDRFLQSTEKDIQKNDIQNGHVFYYDNFYKRSKKNIDIIISKNMNFQKYELKLDSQIETWKLLKDFFKNLDSSLKYIINISTMPRSVLYLFFHFLDERKISYDIYYYIAKQHGNKITQNITKNPLRPKLVMQHSGIADIEKKLILVALVGYDVKRVYQLYNHFEPNKMLIGFENNNKTDALIDKEEIQKELKKNISNIDFFDLNSFDNSLFKTLDENLMSYRDDYNIVLCSLGPKLSAFDVYKYNKQFTETAICYVSSKNYSDDYSSGVDLDTPVIIKIDNSL